MHSEPEIPPFLGFFPPVTDGTLISLVNASTPGHPAREALSPGALAEQRFLALDSLEQMKTHEGHEQAERIAREAVAEGRPFGLYLRNFLLGAQVLPGRDDPHGSPQVLTLASAGDVSMQKLIAGRKRDSIPFVSIANRAADGGPLPHLVLSNEHWERAAEILIRHAGVVVMYFLTLTPGVAREVELLRAAGAAERTLIVVAGEDPREDSMSTTLRLLFGSPEEVEADGEQQPGEAAGTADHLASAPPADFPHVVRLEGDEPEDWEVVARALDALIRSAVPSPQRELPELPPPDRPSPAALDIAREQAIREFDLGVQLFEKGEGEAAEDALIRSIAFSHWSRDPLGRAMAFMQLGHVERLLLKYPNEAVDAYYLALDLFESLLPSSETAVEVYAPLTQGLAAYLEELGDAPRAKAVLARLGRQNESG